MNSNSDEELSADDLELLIRESSITVQQRLAARIRSIEAFTHVPSAAAQGFPLDVFRRTYVGRADIPLSYLKATLNCTCGAPAKVMSFDVPVCLRCKAAIEGPATE